MWLEQEASAKMPPLLDRVAWKGKHEAGSKSGLCSTQPACTEPSRHELVLSHTYLAETLCSSVLPCKSKVQDWNGKADAGLHPL
jgi:hypothetical protein